jgi:predicted secreted protein
MTNKFYAIILMVASFIAVPSLANEIKVENGTILNISVSEMLEVEDDLLVANLRFEYEADDPKSVQNEINKLMKQATDAAKSVPDVAYSTGQYSVYKNNINYQNKNDNKKEYVWHGVQSLDLKSKSVDNILKLTGQLQDLGLVLSNLSYVISPEKMEEVRDSMMEAAIEKLLKKSGRAAKALGKSHVEVVQINIDSNNYAPYPQPMAMMSMDRSYAGKMAAPVAEPGMSQVFMSVSANVLIKE